MTRQIGVLSKNKDYWPTAQLLNELNDRDKLSGVYLSTSYIFPLINSATNDILYANQSLQPLLGAIPRIGRTQTELGLLCLKQFELMEIPTTLSAEALFLSRDKFRCYQTLSTIPGIHLPKTLLINNTYQATELLESFKFPLIIKIRDATGGSGTILSPNKQIAKEIIESMFLRSSTPIMIQEYLRNSTNHKSTRSEDIRVFCIGDKIVGSMKRTAIKGEWRTNYAQGATCEPYELKPEETELIHQIVERIGIEVAGIDLFPTPQGVYVLEMNACPGWKAFQGAHPKINVAKKIIDYLIAKIRV